MFLLAMAFSALDFAALGLMNLGPTERELGLAAWASTIAGLVTGLLLRLPGSREAFRCTWWWRIVVCAFVRPLYPSRPEVEPFLRALCQSQRSEIDAAILVSAAMLATDLLIGRFFPRTRARDFALREIAVRLSLVAAVVATLFLAIGNIDNLGLPSGEFDYDGVCTIGAGDAR